MAGFFANTCLLTYQEGGFLCNDKLRVDAPLSPETLEEAAVQCPKLSGLCLDHTDIGDECFPALARMAKLDMLSLLGSKNITGHGLALLAELPLKQMFLQRTGLDDEGLAQAAKIKTLKKLYIAACPNVTAQGLLDIHWRDGLEVLDHDLQDDWGRAGLFTREERKAYEDARAYKSMKNVLPLTAPELAGPIAALEEFFQDMTRWEALSVRDLDGPGVREDLEGLFARRVCGKLKPGYRPVHLHSTRGGTYSNYQLTRGERVTKHKFWIYAEHDIFYHRFLLRLVEGSWMIDSAQWCRQGKWSFHGL